MKIREIDWERDGECIRSFNASFTTCAIYRVKIAEMSVELVAEHLKIPFQKKYMLDDVSESDHAYAAEIGGEIAGFIELRIEEWNRRAVLTHLYVAPGFQQRGIGKALLDAAANYAKTQAARCLWLETQNVNYPAIQFYKKLGFSFCGFDKSLYDGAEADETALFFCRSI